ncbi:hypothetical protein [Leptolyngbya ohadii]|uniref:hypothetical protein n=1 Tax=Leptolyngbya ohadii TaxID=1962290 RepID=UPI000B59DE0B|nr:hypothetical protein [Leptolyngbya ohadii]
MNGQTLRLRKTAGLGAIALLLVHLGIASPVHAQLPVSELPQPGMSDGAGTGIDLSISDTVDNADSPLLATPASSVNAADPQSPDAADSAIQNANPAPPQREVRLFGDSDRSFGIEILNRSNQGQQRIRIGIPFL